MGCNCGKTASGAQVVYQLHYATQPVRTFSSKAEADIANSRDHAGRATVIRTTQRAQ